MTEIVRLKGMKILTFFNHAGGAGKTSLALNVGYTFTRLAARTLLIDLDPQANLTTWMGLPVPVDADTAFNVAVGADGHLPAPKLAYKTKVIPSNLHLALAEGQMMAQEGATLNLRYALKAVEDQYDLVVIDSPPSLGKLSVLAALAADHLIVPVPTRAKGLNGLPGVLAALETYRRLRPDLHVGMFVPTLYDSRNSHDRQVLDALREQLHPMAEPLTYRPAVWNDSAGAGEPLSVYSASSPATTEVFILCKQLGTELEIQIGKRYEQR